MKKIFSVIAILIVCNVVYGQINPGNPTLSAPIESEWEASYFEVMLYGLRDRALIYHLLVIEAVAMALLTVSIFIKGTKSKTTTALFLINIFILVLLALPNLLDVM